MGFINLLKNGYRGKLGETVGQQWKNQLTVRTYQATNNSKSEAQLEQREKYKTLIEGVSLYWPSALNIKAPKGKSMSDFNYYASIINKYIAEKHTPGTFRIIDQYNKKNICQAFVMQKDNTLWAYILLPEGHAPKDMSKYIGVVLFAIDAKAQTVISMDSLFTGNIIPKRVKQGAPIRNIARGFFAQINPTLDGMKAATISIGKKEGNIIKYSGFIATQRAVTITDDMLEDL